MSAQQENNYNNVYQLAVRTVRLEADYKNIKEQLDKIEARLNDALESLQTIRDHFSMSTGMTNIKNKVWVVIYSLVTVCATLGLHTFLFKHFGVEL